MLRTDGELPETLKDTVCYIADTTGELRDWTALADVAVIGKSFLADGGQNPAEAVACGVPVLTGPHMENFAAIAKDFADARAWVQATDAADLKALLLKLLGNAAERSRLGRAAAELVARQAGATRRMAERVLAARATD